MIQPPSDPEHPAYHGFTTTSLFASGQLGDVAALDRALEAFHTFCDDHRLQRAAVPGAVPAAFPCWLVVTLRHHVTTRQQLGRLELTRADGRCSFGHHWTIRSSAVDAQQRPARPVR